MNRSPSLLIPLTLYMLAILITAGPATAQTCCEFHKASFTDYAPQGMPDFDQKQNQPAWSDGTNPTHCGPLAVANSLWWFDSKFDGIVSPPIPPAISDGFSLITPFGAWDDHHPLQVIPLVNSLATLMQTNLVVKGTTIDSLVSGTRQFIANAGLSASFSDTLVAYPTFAFIKQQTLQSCNVILLLGFYEDDALCCRIGGHYVTVAGVCTTSTQICVSDPWFDATEGEPPAGAAHGPNIHNDAAIISGPHGQGQHDAYTLTSTSLSCPGVAVEEMNFPFTAAERTNFLFQNGKEGAQCNLSGAPVKTVIEYAYVICADSVLVGVGDNSASGLPDGFSLSQNYPNPFNLSTVINYTLPRRSAVEIMIFNQLGQRVATLVNESQAAGSHRVIWRGRNSSGQVVASGVYFYSIQTENHVDSRKMILLK